MKKNIIIISLGLCSLYYWGEFIIKNPYKSDIEIICQNIHTQSLDKVIIEKLKSSSSKQIIKLLKNMPIKQRYELLNDYSKSKGLEFICRT